MAKSKWPEVKRQLDNIKAWCRSGALEKDIAKRLGVSVSTFESYKKKYPELLEALKNNKEGADDQVENALFEKCIGKYIDEEYAFKCKKVFYDEQGRRCEEEEIKTVVIKRFLPPDTTAQLAWLNNRRSYAWRRNAGKEKLDEKKFQHEKDIDGKKYF